MKRQIALALSGGGARGMAEIGVIRELLARGYAIHSISGCSIGSVVGAMYAMGKLDEFADFLLQDGAQAVFSQLDFTFSDHGFIKGKKLIDRLQEFAPDCNIEDLPIKLVIVATDMNTGKDVVYRTGSVYRAIRASVAIPAVITAVEEDGHWLIDGGVVNPLPIQQLNRIPGDLLVAVNLYASPVFPSDKELATQEKEHAGGGVVSHMRARLSELKDWKGNLVRNVFDDTHRKMGYFTTLRLMSELASKRLAEIAVQTGHVDLLIEIPIASCGLFSFDKAPQMMQLGQEKTREGLNSLERKDAYRQNAASSGFWHQLLRFFGNGKN